MGIKEQDSHLETYPPGMSGSVQTTFGRVSGTKEAITLTRCLHKSAPGDDSSRLHLFKLSTQTLYSLDPKMVAGPLRSVGSDGLEWAGEEEEVTSQSFASFPWSQVARGARPCNMWVQADSISPARFPLRWRAHLSHHRPAQLDGLGSNVARSHSRLKTPARNCCASATRAVTCHLGLALPPCLLSLASMPCH